MSARLLDTLCAQHKDTVVILDGGQSVGDSQGRAAMGQLFEALAHQNFALIVEGAGGFVLSGREYLHIYQSDAGSESKTAWSKNTLNRFILDMCLIFLRHDVSP